MSLKSMISITSVAEIWRKHMMFDVDKWKGSFFSKHQKLA